MTEAHADSCVLQFEHQSGSLSLKVSLEKHREDGLGLGGGLFLRLQSVNGEVERPVAEPGARLYSHLAVLLQSEAAGARLTGKGAAAPIPVPTESPATDEASVRSERRPSPSEKVVATPAPLLDAELAPHIYALHASGFGVMKGVLAPVSMAGLAAAADRALARSLALASTSLEQGLRIAVHEEDAAPSYLPNTCLYCWGDV